jgi:hypothetical protein
MGHARLNMGSLLGILEARTRRYESQTVPDRRRWGRKSGMYCAAMLFVSTIAWSWLRLLSLSGLAHKYSHNVANDVKSESATLDPAKPLMREISRIEGGL